MQFRVCKLTAWVVIPHNVLSKHKPFFQNLILKSRRLPGQKWLHHNCQVRWCIKLIHFIPHSFNKYFLNLHYMPGTVPRATDKKRNKMWSFKGPTWINKNFSFLVLMCTLGGEGLPPSRAIADHPEPAPKFWRPPANSHSTSQSKPQTKLCIAFCIYQIMFLSLWLP